MNEAEWKSAEELTGFVLAGTKNTASQQTSVRVLFDDQALYLGFTCMDAKMADVVAKAAKRDGGMESDDRIEVLLGPTHDRFNFFQFAVTVGGARFDASGDGAGVAADWDAPWEAAATRDKDRWCAEVAIPFSILQLSDKVGEIWDMNLCRVERPDSERSSWSPAGDRFTAPQTFGTLTGLKADFVPFYVSIGPAVPIAPAFGRNVATVRLANEGAKPRKLRCDLTVYSPSEKPRTVNSADMDLAPKTHVNTELAYQIFEPGAHRLVAEAVDVATGRQVAAFERNVNLSSPVEHCLFYSYYRDDVSIRSQLNLSPDELASCRLIAMLASAEENKALVWADVTSSKREVTTTLPLNGLKPGRYRIRMQFERNGKVEHRQELAFALLRGHPVESLQVHPRGDLMLVVGGKPFFPLGIYEAPVTQRMIDEFKAAGFNTVHLYGGSPTALKMVLDRLHEHGLKAWVSLSSGLDLSQNEEKRKDILRQTVESIGRHPALLVWESIDEPAWGSQSADGLLKGYEFLRVLDPNHPVWTNHAPRNHISTLAYFNRATDIGGCDIYPVPEPQTQSNLPNKTLSVVGDETDKNRAAVNDEKPIFMVLQGFAWKALHKPDDPSAVYPDLHQQRYMAYNAILHGANGILYWGTHYTPKPSKAWADVKTIVHELSCLSPVLVAPKPTAPPTVTSDTKGVEVMMRQVGAETYLILVNNENRPAKGAVSGLPKGLGELRVLYEKDRRLAVRDGAMEFSLSGYGVIVATSDRKFDDTRPDYSAELKLAAPAPSLDQMREPGNLVVNPSFEFDTAGTNLPDLWQCRFPFSAVLATDQPHSGKRCLKIDSPDADFKPLLVQQNIAVEGNREYELSAWFRSDGGGIEGRVYAEWVIGGKFHSAISPWTKGTSNWQQITKRFTATPPPGSRLYVVVQTQGKGTAWFDDVNLTPVGK